MPLGAQRCLLVKEASGTCCPLQDPEGVDSCWLLLQLAHSAPHSKVSTVLPCPRGCAGSRPAWAGFAKHRDPRLTRPRPLAVPWRAGRTTFFWLDFCPCSSVPRGPSEGLGHRTWELQSRGPLGCMCPIREPPSPPGRAATWLQGLYQAWCLPWAPVCPSNK